MAFIYGIFYGLFFLLFSALFLLTFRGLVFLTTIPTIFANIYHEAPGIAGLHYIALGIGLSAASQINARLLDRIYIHFKNKNGGVGEPEFRLRRFLFFSFFLSITDFLTQRQWSLLASSFLLDCYFQGGLHNIIYLG